jgi:hypothetical protein
MRHASARFTMTAMIIAYNAIIMLNEELCYRVISSGMFTEAMNNSDDGFVFCLRMGVRGEPLLSAEGLLIYSFEREEAMGDVVWHEPILYETPQSTKKPMWG